jgi:hypothetical protein
MSLFFTRIGAADGAGGMPIDDSMRIESCDTCIVGAGIAGMNALFVASRYLDRNQRVILVDRRHRVGGMWVDTYPYVRLHQPHGLFTAGNIAWTLGRDPSYLANGDEVLDHFEHCLTVLRRRVQVDELFGWAVVSHDVVDGVVTINCRSADGRPLAIKAKRLIKAAGFAIQPNDPLPVSSSRVRSVSPDTCDVRAGEMAASDAPVWVIGGGKTAMDTAHALVAEYPGREVNLVAGSGTYFWSREQLFPTGIRRWWAGTSVPRIGSTVARLFDGTNEVDIAAWLRPRYCTWLTPQTGNFMLGILSEAENKAIAAGLHEVVMDYLEDVVDRGDAIEMQLRGGARRPIRPGSWIVNCTGYLMHDELPYEPYASAGGAVVSIQSRSATMHLTSYMSYYLTHLLFLDRLREVPLYELDMDDLRAKSNAALPFAIFALVALNTSLLFDAVPKSVFAECGVDYARWYPMPRRLLEAARLLRTHRSEREWQRRALDAVRERFGVRCGPLPSI